MSRTRFLPGIAPAVALFVATLASGQTIPWPRGDRLTAVVSPDSVTLSATSGVLSIRYRLRNQPASEQAARILMIEARAPVQDLKAPQPAGRWVHVGPQPSDSVAFWGSASRDQDVSPGSARTGFEIVTASALPGIVRFWVQGRFQVPTVTEAQEDSVEETPLVENNSFAGMTVGPVRTADQSVGALLARLGRLELQACSLSWITNAGVCHSLKMKLDQASAALTRGDAESAKGQLGAFLDELNAQHGAEPGKHVTDNAYWLLRVNVQFVLYGL